jgi:hypothetical protein
MENVPQLVTLAQARKHVNVDHTDDDVKLAEIVIQASAVVLNYLNQYPRGEYEALPVYDPTAAPVLVAPWPWEWVASTTRPPYWWPTTRIIYQQLPPYIADGWDQSGSPAGEVPGAVTAATLLVIGALYRDREGQTDPISTAVKSLLGFYKQPPMA